MGNVVLKCLRGDARTASIPVVIVSSDAIDRQIQRLLEAGAAAYLSKPFDVRQFLETIDDLIREQNPPATGGDGAP